jgi:hypothetical protein
MAASARATSVAAVTTQISKTRSSTVTFSSVPCTETDLTASCFAIGESASAPATFGGMVHPDTHGLDTIDRITLDKLAGTTSGSFTADPSSQTAGQRLWLAYFQGVNPPISGTVPDSSFDLGLLLA